jgi:hypothetical protein
MAPQCINDILEKSQDWFFTFGSSHVHEGCYTIINGTYDSAREEMMRRYGPRWSMQYPSAEHAGVERWKLKKIK